ncbi:UDP-N-acetylmuramate dehydrogenase [Traorella massiliensis]|uniref:UDP-N-acetylmuramate dehydrogenase n=1 Tax=Traorella massiliensis TaxID=1903263 RepID=UPI0008F93A81|nr:UDP-N-acetylmuramate dehydrogenase [Traorella massiliensis]
MDKIEIRKDEYLKEYTTLHIGGKCKKIFFPKNEEEVKKILAVYQPIILGNGSNVLISDEREFETAMILTQMNHIECHKDMIIADAGAKLMDVCLFAYQKGLSGLEFAYGIPGSTGGAILMNAGAYGGEISDVVERVKTIKKEYSKEECAFKYRHSIFSDNDECITMAVFRLKKGDPEMIRMKMKELIAKRIEKQPLDQYSAGSTFKRGPDFYASQLINDCNLKGYRVGDAAVSEKHAGFLINRGHASFHDFLTLIQKVQKIVYEKTSKKLECEIKIIES